MAGPISNEARELFEAHGIDGLSLLLIAQPAAAQADDCLLHSLEASARQPPTMGEARQWLREQAVVTAKPAHRRPTGERNALWWRNTRRIWWQFGKFVLALAAVAAAVAVFRDGR